MLLLVVIAVMGVRIFPVLGLILRLVLLIVVLLVLALIVLLIVIVVLLMLFGLLLLLLSCRVLVDGALLLCGGHCIELI